MSRIRGNESGQSLVIVVLAMVVVFGMAALAIDLASAYQKRHQAQVSADAAALAAANCLASSKCTSTAANGDASNTATTIATQNGVPASSVQIGGGYVTVTTATQAPGTFGGLFGLNRDVSAHAIASYTRGHTEPASIYGADCANPTLPPATSASGCTVNCSPPGITITANGTTDISGAIITNGSTSINIGGSTTLGAVEYGQSSTGSACATTPSVTGNATITSGPGQEGSWTPFPETFNGVWTSATNNECSSSSAYTNGGFNGSSNISVSGGTSTVPGSVAFKGNNSSFGGTSAPVIVCANTITLSGNAMTLTNITLVANTFVFSGNGFSITPSTNATPDGGGSPNVAIYSYGTSTVNFGNNNVSIAGVVYAPLTEILLGANNGSPGLLEGNTVEIDGNNTGDGPTQTITFWSGGDSLYQ